jgi:hypothetical protein
MRSQECLVARGRAAIDGNLNQCFFDFINGDAAVVGRCQAFSFYARQPTCDVKVGKQSPKPRGRFSRNALDKIQQIFSKMFGQIHIKPPRKLTWQIGAEAAS